MGFKENILQKIRFDQLHTTIVNSLGPPDSGRRLDKEAMTRLLKYTGYAPATVRDLELYIKPDSGDPPAILLLDNELKVYKTTPEDVALRKSPTVKEMVSIRNAIKILNDKDVVISRGRETADGLHAELVAALDLSFTSADLDGLVADGNAAFENAYADGIVEILTIFMEILEWPPAPKALQLSHHRIWGRRLAKAVNETVLSPVVIYSLIHNTLCLSETQVRSRDADRQEMLHAIIDNAGEDGETLAGAAVWEALKRRAHAMSRG
ncbi:MAG: hypothetical protein QNJ22_03960 [Desulfosarcinaceae bacterium]|nr:hypothetical protein [Desulfosarcinaceae bacterium]